MKTASTRANEQGSGAVRRRRGQSRDSELRQNIIDKNSDTAIESMATRLGFDIRRYDQCQSLALRGWYHALRDRLHMRDIMCAQDHLWREDPSLVNPSVRIGHMKKLLQKPCNPYFSPDPDWIPPPTLSEPAVRTATSRNCLEALRPETVPQWDLQLRARLAAECLVIVDRRHSDSQLKRDFNRWLAEQRAAERLSDLQSKRKKSPKAPGHPKFTANEIRRWAKWRVLACMDLDLLAHALNGEHGLVLSKSALARLLFESDPNGDGPDQVRNIVRPLARYLMRHDTLEALAAEIDGRTR